MKKSVYWNGSCEMFKCISMKYNRIQKDMASFKKSLFDALDDFPCKQLFMNVKQSLIIKIKRI